VCNSIAFSSLHSDAPCGTLYQLQLHCTREQDQQLLTVECTHTCTGHSRPVACVRWHPTNNNNNNTSNNTNSNNKKLGLLLSASRDGTCRLWRWQREEQAALLVAPTPRSSSSSRSAKANSAAAGARVECRSCAFSPDGQTVYTVQVSVPNYSYHHRFSQQCCVCISVGLQLYVLLSTNDTCL
jgi:WD40 repeat protein